MDTITENFSEKGDKREIARMTSLGLPHAGNWLSVVPSPAPGLHLRSSEILPGRRPAIVLTKHISKNIVDTRYGEFDTDVFTIL